MTLGIDNEIRIRVTAPPFCDHDSIDDQGYVTMDPGATLNDIYKVIKVPIILRRLLITSVNGERSKPSTSLSDSDDVSIFWPIMGG